MSEEFPIDRSKVESEIRHLIVDKGLDHLTSKIIRKHLEEEFNCKLDAYKKVIDQITLEQITAQEESSKQTDHNEIQPQPQSSKSIVNDYANNSSHQEHTSTCKLSDYDAKKTSKLSDSDDTDSKSYKDELYDNSSSKKARKRKTNGFEKHNSQLNLEEEDMASVVKRRRGANIKQKREVQKKEKSKEKKSKGTRPFQRICVLSDDLCNLIGKRYMRRSDVVKWMWAYFNENELKDPKNKQMIILDDSLKTVFGQAAKRIKGFTMMQRLQRHIKDAEFLDAATRQKVEAELSAEDDESQSSNQITPCQSNEVEVKSVSKSLSSEDSVVTSNSNLYSDTFIDNNVKKEEEDCIKDENKSEESKSEDSSSGESSSSDDSSSDND